MASDQKCVIGEGSPSAWKYDTSWMICHQLLKNRSVGITSGRILVSSAWLKMVQRKAMPSTANTTAGMMRLTRRSQKLERLMVPVSSYSLMSRPVIR